MEYNTERTNMIIPEYGRNIHKMIRFAITIKDRNKRNKCAWNIIKLMGDLNTYLRDVPDFQHKLWDQLFIMSNFELDVDSPFKKPEKFNKTYPKKMHYPEQLKELRYYGKIIKDMIKVAIYCEKKDKKEGLIYAIANTMKKSHIKWNKETVNDSIIINDLKKLSKYRLHLNSYNDPLINTESIINHNKRKNKSQYYHQNNRRKRFYSKNN